MTAATAYGDANTQATVDSARVAGRWRRLLRGRPTDPRWARPALLALLAATALLYLWDLSASGWANSYYSAAVQAGSQSWKAFFFGSFDAGNAITVDKPPAALWVMDLSARVFGVNAWSILVPQALQGVATVGLLHATVRRWYGPAAGLLAGAVLALTPAAALMFRFNNPDALLTLLLVAAAYAVTRAVEVASTRWLVLAGALVGFGFLTKMLQAILLVPVFALVYLVAAPTSLRRRILQLLAAGAALLAAAGWWVAVVELCPAGDRPYVGGSQSNSVLDLVFGYNGFGRLTGNETGSVGGGGPAGPGGAGGPGGRGGGDWGETGLGRMFNSEIGGQISWLIPAALVLLATLLWLTRRTPRTDRTRTAMLLWGGWLVVTGAVFSYMQGIFHPYYTVALAPGIAAVVGIGAVTLWRHRSAPVARATLAVAVSVTALWAFVLLDRTPDWQPWLRPVVLAVGLTAALVLLVGPTRLAGGVLAAGLLVGTLAAPAAYAIETVTTPHSGAIPSAGPAGGGFGGPRGAGPGGGGPGLPGGGTGQPGGGQAGGFPGGQFPQFPSGAQPPSGMDGTGGTGGQGGMNGQRGGLGGGFGGGGRGGGQGLGGLLDAQKPSSELVSTLTRDAGHYTWVAATVGANNAAGIQLGTGRAVLAIGGFNGTDPSPTLAEFQRLVARGEIHYYLAGGMGGPGGRGGDGGTSGQIADWVEQNFTAQTIDNTSVYDLTATSQL